MSPDARAKGLIPRAVLPGDGESVTRHLGQCPQLQEHQQSRLSYLCNVPIKKSSHGEREGRGASGCQESPVTQPHLGVTGDELEGENREGIWVREHGVHTAEVQSVDHCLRLF